MLHKRLSARTAPVALLFLLACAAPARAQSSYYGYYADSYLSTGYQYAVNTANAHGYTGNAWYAYYYAYYAKYYADAGYRYNSSSYYNYAYTYGSYAYQYALAAYNQFRDTNAYYAYYYLYYGYLNAYYAYNPASAGGGGGGGGSSQTIYGTWTGTRNYNGSTGSVYLVIAHNGNNTYGNVWYTYHTQGISPDAGGSGNFSWASASNTGVSTWVYGNFIELFTRRPDSSVWLAGTLNSNGSLSISIGNIEYTCYRQS
jgi:hypothetical protein